MSPRRLLSELSSYELNEYQAVYQLRHADEAAEVDQTDENNKHWLSARLL